MSQSTFALEGNYIGGVWEASRTKASADVLNPATKLTINRVPTLDEAIEEIARSAYGNSAAIFTSSGAAARKFRYEVSTGNVGVNIGVAAHGLLPVQRVARQFHGSAARTGQRCHRVLYREESSGRALAQGMIAAILIGA